MCLVHIPRARQQHLSSNGCQGWQMGCHGQHCTVPGMGGFCVVKYDSIPPNNTYSSDAPYPATVLNCAQCFSGPASGAALKCFQPQSRPCQVTGMRPRLAGSLCSSARVQHAEPGRALGLISSMVMSLYCVFIMK